MLRKLSIFVLIVLSIIFCDMRAHAASSPVFGPKKYTREKGSPDEMKESINVCAASGEYRLVVENGAYTVTETDDKKNKSEKKTQISAAEIKIDGNKLIKEDDLKNKVARFEKTVTLSAGTHTMQVEVDGKPGAFITVTLECISGCVEAQINLPYAGASITNTEALVTGRILNANGEVGVALSTTVMEAVGGDASVIGQVYGNAFAADAPLTLGVNTIAVTVTDTCGLTTQAVVAVDVVPGSFVNIVASPENGIPSQTGLFETTLRANARIGALVADYSWDLDGDGIIDKSGKDSSSAIASYASTGLYYPKVIVTDTAGNQYSDTAVVNVISMVEADALLKAKWDGMKAGLAAGDAEKAAGYFLAQSQGRYMGTFTLLKDDLPQIAAEMDPTELIYLKNGVAKYRIRRTEAEGNMTYYIYFGQDRNGIWKIKQF